MNRHWNVRGWNHKLMAVLAAMAALSIAGRAVGAKEVPLRTSLKSTPLKIAWECYVNGNWEIFVMNADGSHKVNLTNTPHQNEHYPQISPDGTKIAYSVDTGEGREAVRSLWVMDINGKHRRKIADNAREPFWRPDGRIIGYLPQEYPRFDVIDYYTNGMEFYDLKTGKSTPHPNSAKLHHLYNPNFSPNGKWIVSTVHAGMGFGHAILLIEVHGDRIIDLKIPGCRPRLSTDNKHIAWGPGDHELALAPIDLDADTPSVGPWSLHITDEKNKIYHIDWSPDGRYVAFSRGPEGEGDLSKPGSFTAACEIVGVYAGGWNICAVSAKRTGTIDLQKATDADYVQLTSNGSSNKQPKWFRPGQPGRE
jgi:dipeptidyl aminopeptidase/acylaminoacyl peptidase